MLGMPIIAVPPCSVMRVYFGNGRQITALDDLQVHFSAINFWFKRRFVRTNNICDLYVDMVMGEQILLFGIVMLSLCFWTKPQKYQTLVPAKNSHRKVAFQVNDSAHI